MASKPPAKSAPKVVVTVTRGPAARKEMESMERDAKRDRDRDKPKGKR